MPLLPVIVLLLLAAAFLVRRDAAAAAAAAAWYVSPPTCDGDFRQLARIVTQTFDAAPLPRPPSTTSSSVATASASAAAADTGYIQQKDQQQLGTMTWNLFERHLTEQFNYKHYVRTSRRMVGLKYAIFVAKEEEASSGNDRVIGVVEIGMKRVQGADGAVGSESPPQAYPTIGSLCVDAGHRRRGVAKGLIGRCEDLVLNTWTKDDDDATIVAEVRVSNQPARAFFESRGYRPLIRDHHGSGDEATTGDSTGQRQEERQQDVAMVKVQHRRRLELIPHVILSKKLERQEGGREEQQRGGATEKTRSASDRKAGPKKQWIW